MGYAYLKGPKSLAARAIDPILIGGDRLDQTRADEIVAHHIHPEPPVSSGQRADVRRQALQLSKIAAGATVISGQISRDLSDSLDAIGDGADVTSIVRSMAERAGSSETALAAASSQTAALRQEVEAAKDDAARDALTGLHNRRGLKSAISASSSRGRSALILCDIDHFKSVNDRFGHVVGDRVLKLVASSLVKSCNPHLVARWGGKESLIVARGMTAREAGGLIDRARLDLGDRRVHLRETDEPMGRITFSAGVAPFNGRGFHDALGNADALLYQAKARGRDQVMI